MPIQIRQHTVLVVSQWLHALHVKPNNVQRKLRQCFGVAATPQFHVHFVVLPMLLLLLFVFDFSIFRNVKTIHVLVVLSVPTDDHLVAFLVHVVSWKPKFQIQPGFIVQFIG